MWLIYIYTTSQTCEILKLFHTFVKDEVNILDLILYVKDNKLEYRSFRGPEHRRLMAPKLDLEVSIPSHPKLDQLKKKYGVAFQSLCEKWGQI